jgi:hypothetical protein
MKHKSKAQFHVDTNVLRISYKLYSPHAYNRNTTRGLFKADGTELFPREVQVAYPKLPKSWINEQS